MTIDLTDTTTGAIDQALTEARRRLGGMTLGMVLTLIIVTDGAAQSDAIRAANQAATEHPCRVLAVITRKPKADSRLDAEIRVGEAWPGETIVLRMYGPLGQHADSVIAPLLVPDVPVVTWWPDESPEIPAKNPLGALAQRRVTDSAAAEAPHEVLAALAAGYQPGDTDFGWTRATPWRSLLAATLDQPHPPVTSGEIAAEPGNPTADLIAAWLSLRRAVPVSRTVSARTVPGLAAATAARGPAHVVLTGGGIGTKVLAAIAAAPARDAVDWRLVDFWWGDERFEVTGDPERNETGARAALLDALGVDPARVHAVPGPDGPDGDDPDAAAARYAAELAAAAGASGAVPAFHLLLLRIA